MSANMVAVLYLISALMFIFALRGLSHPESSRLGNIFGIVGMIIAIITTLMFKSVLSYVEIGAARISYIVPLNLGKNIPKEVLLIDWVNNVSINKPGTMKDP